jgi:hypothetical protein
VHGDCGLIAESLFSFLSLRERIEVRVIPIFDFRFLIFDLGRDVTRGNPASSIQHPVSGRKGAEL